MATLKKKGITKKQLSGPQRSFSEPFYYTRTTFGIKNGAQDDSVSSFSLNVSTAQLEKSFKIFEEMPNVHEWPISKLIQRELDKQRASMISRDYLLSEGYLKYFPPITAVLIPTNREHKPEDAYFPTEVGEVEQLRKFVLQQVDDGDDKSEEAASKYVSAASIIAGGIYDINNGPENGILMWDKNAVTAVIIDGQHRYKALVEAMGTNKDFQECLVSVNLIDLVPICEREKIGPTAVARDLFVSINNTPVEVDEARLVLMDDRDALATFTQVLVDDSDNTAEPVLRPEIIDWKCEQGKHDNALALTGVLTLRGVVGAALFENRSIASVDSREDRKHVKKWLSSLEQWMQVDAVIEKTLSKSETLRQRYDAACALSEAEEDEEETQPFLFSYSAAAAAVIKNRFRELYLGVFRKVYRELTPYEEAIRIAENNGAFNKSAELHRYLRAFSGQRQEMERKSPEIKKAVSAFRKQFKEYSENHILVTVMGQKALFKALFERYLSIAEEIRREDLETQADEFIEDFNQAYALLHKSKTFDECFFSTRLRLKKGVRTTQAGDLGREFWRGIILGYKGEIDYGSTAVDILKQVLTDILFYLRDKEPDAFEFSDRKKIIMRHVRLLQRHDSDVEDEAAESIATEIVVAKEALINKLLAA